ncbi:Oxidoreductase AflY [Grifola frondosa]|uniref:Oxidoreductase AflY n=1 Tax=Grifola frondosa TaxID=5627 RepID=A0A1C7MAA6_GRIFR|nr:Oxidoreductase AflY [Grifola frondosa]
MTSSDSYSLQRKGLLHLPGINAKTKQVAEDILRYDVDNHHCFYRAPSIHNHLSHHLLAAYDLGGTASLLKKIEKRRETMQRPIQLDPKDKDIIITDQNWVQYVGNANAYYGYYNFFAGEIKSIGVTATLERYIFSEHANAGGATMIIRTMSGALHPFIQIGVRDIVVFRNNQD